MKKNVPRLLFSLMLLLYSTSSFALESDPEKLQNSEVIQDKNALSENEELLLDDNLAIDERNEPSFTQKVKKRFIEH